MSQTNRILRRPDVEHLTGFKRSMIYLMMQRGTFPKPVKLSERAIGWRESDVAAWLSSREAT
ncbi:MAG: AlpA family transcriptional regulator [Albidovulum sp.]|uniref:helix-turn-helix transcriptional regulator n=1 Tax=Albidovulum sp. TaxID=1872424 RepID=UPI003CA143AA